MSTNYPTALDTTSNLPDSLTDATPTAVTHEEHHNTISDAIIAIETALGTTPYGSYATVKAAIADMVQKTPSAADQIITPGADHVALAVKQGNSLYISNLFEARDSAGNVKFYVDKGGNINAQAINVAGSPIAASNLSNGVSGTGAVVLATSPTLTTASLGSSTATTQSQSDNSTKLATTAYVRTAISAITVPVTSVFGRTGAVVATSGDYTDAQVTNSPTNKLTTTGDLLYASAANTLARLAIGSTGGALRVASGIPAWKTLASNSGALGTYTGTSGTSGATSARMLGIGMTITPTATGTVIINLASALAGGWTNCDANFQLSYGTGTAPGNQAAGTGTLFGSAFSIGTGGNISGTSLAMCGRLSGLSVGTTYWVDIEITFTASQSDQSPGISGGMWEIHEVG